jgi:hypothetical protein
VIDNDINGEKISVITPEITQLILEEQAEISNGNILKIITESKARVNKLLKEHHDNSRQFFFFNIESSEDYLRSHVGSKVYIVILYVDLVS